MTGRQKRRGRWVELEWPSQPSAEDVYFTEPIEEPDYTGEIILALASLTPKQRFVIECRFGFRSEESLTLDEIAALMGTTNQAVSRIETRAMQRISRGLENSSIDA